MCTVGQLVSGKIQFITDLDLGTSSGLMETELGFTFAAILLLLIRDRERFWSMVCIFAVVITFKRMAFVAILLTAMIGIMHSLMPKGIRRSVRFLWLAVSATLLAATALSADLIYQVVADTYFPGASANQISLGRFNMLSWAKTHFFAAEAANQLFGFGPASINYFFFYNWRPGFEHGHNDYMKLLFDYGWIGLCLLLLSFAALFSRNERTFVVGVFAFIIFISDNVLIYATFMIPAAYCSLVCETNHLTMLRRSSGVLNG